MINRGLQESCGQPDDTILVVIVEFRAILRVLRVMRRQMAMNSCARMVLVALVDVLGSESRSDGDLGRQHQHDRHVSRQHGCHYGSHRRDGQTMSRKTYMRQAYWSLTSS